MLYQYENLTEDLEEEVKTGEKKRRAGGDSKVVVNVICGKLPLFTPAWNSSTITDLAESPNDFFQLKSSNGNTYVELKCSDVEDDEEERVEFINNNK